MDININEPDVLPFAHYWVDCFALDDDVPEERARGIKNDHELLRRGFIDEMWLCGDRISNGTAAEVALAVGLRIPVIEKLNNVQKVKASVARNDDSSNTDG